MQFVHPPVTFCFTVMVLPYIHFVSVMMSYGPYVIILSDNNGLSLPDGCYSSNGAHSAYCPNA